MKKGTPKTSEIPKTDKAPKKTDSVVAKFFAKIAKEFWATEKEQEEVYKKLAKKQ